MNQVSFHQSSGILFICSIASLENFTSVAKLCTSLLFLKGKRANLLVTTQKIWKGFLKVNPASYVGSCAD